MKTNLKQNGTRLRGTSLMTNFFVWTGAAAFVAMLAGIATLEQQLNHLDAEERESAMIDHLVQMKQSNYLLHQLGSGAVDTARHSMTLGLMEDIRQAKSLAAGLDEPQRTFAESLCQRVLLEQKKHPEFYLTTVVGEAEGKVLKAIEHEKVAPGGNGRNAGQ